MSEQENPLDKFIIPIKKTFSGWLKSPREKGFTLKQKLEELGFKYKSTKYCVYVCEGKRKDILIGIDFIQYILGVYVNGNLTKFWTFFSGKHEQMFIEVKKELRKLDKSSVNK